MTDLAQARRFLRLLDPGASQFTFQTIYDVARGVKARSDLARVICSTIDEALLRHLYDHGSGVWITVNAADQRGRKAENITRIRATWQEDDGGYAGTFPLAPSITVESSPGKYPRYWLTDIPATEETRQQHRGVMGRMVESYGSDKAATDISRVLRVPGFLHRKAAPFMVRIVEAGGYRYWWADILEAFPAPPRAEAKPHTACQPRDDDDERIASALEHIPADDRATWLSVGMALQSHYGERGRDLFGRWSATSAKYDAADLDRVWRSFGKRSGITIATLFHQAMQHGWEPPERLERPASHPHVRRRGRGMGRVPGRASRRPAQAG